MDILKKIKEIDIASRHKDDYFIYCVTHMTDLEGQTECPTLTFEEFVNKYGYSEKNKGN